LNSAVASLLSLLHEAFDSLLQQDLHFAHFFFFPLSVFAKAIPLNKKAAAANINTFFIVCDLVFEIMNTKSKQTRLKNKP